MYGYARMSARTLKDQRRVSEPLEWELQVVNCQTWAPRPKLGSSARAARAFNYCAISSFSVAFKYLGSA